MRGFVAGGMILGVASLLAGCQGLPGQAGTPEQQRYAARAEQQEERARDAGRDYLACVDRVETRTSRNRLGNGFTSPEVILDSCATEFERVSIILEQAYDNACRAGKPTEPERQSCDAESVREAKRETDILQHEARDLIRRRDDRNDLIPLPGR